MPFTDFEGTERAAEVEGGSRYDAVGLAIARFREARRVLCVDPRSRFTEGAALTREKRGARKTGLG